MKSIILLLMPFYLWALPLDHSFICRDKDRTSYKGIECCLDRIDEKQCRHYVDHLLPINGLDQANRIKNDILQGIHEVPAVPNCHFTAVNFNFPGLLPVAKLEDDHYRNILESHYRRIEESELEYGDLVLFYLTAKEKVYHPNTFKVSFKSVEGMAHSATYLGDGVIFQKESNLTHIYSIDLIEGTRRAYQSFMNSPKLLSVRITPYYYRPVSN